MRERGKEVVQTSEQVRRLVDRLASSVACSQVINATTASTSTRNVAHSAVASSPSSVVCRPLHLTICSCRAASSVSADLVQSRWKQATVPRSLWLIFCAGTHMLFSTLVRRSAMSSLTCCTNTADVVAYLVERSEARQHKGWWQRK